MAKTPSEVDGLVMGFDFGLKRIGVAIGQTISQTASPEAIVASRDGRPDWDHITQLIEHWHPCALVVGLPMRLNGEEQALTQPARKFGQRLSGRYQTPVFYIEEQLSSIEAENRFKASRKPARKGGHTQSLDDHAAQIILQNWLENRETDSN